MKLETVILGKIFIKLYSYNCRRSSLEKPGAEVIEVEDQPSSGRASRNWARLIKKFFEVDPLLCPDCGGKMKIIAFIEELSVIRKILEHLDLLYEQEPRPPPAREEAENVLAPEYVPCFD